MSLPESTFLRLRTQLDCLETILAGAPDGALERRPVVGKWSALENLAHLARHHEVFLERIQLIWTAQSPQLPRYRAEDDPAWPQWAAKPAGEVLDLLKLSRLKLIGVVEQISPGELARTGIHSRFGEMTVVEWLEFFLLHEAHHLFATMQRIRE